MAFMALAAPGGLAAGLVAGGFGLRAVDGNGDGPLTIRYAEIRTIRFTGRDTAAGNSYAAWLRAREAAKKTSGAPPAAGA